MITWIKQYPLPFFLLLSLAVHLVAVASGGFWGRGRPFQEGAVIEFDYYRPKPVEESINPPPLLPAEEVRIETDKNFKIEVSEAEPQNKLVQPVVVSDKPGRRDENQTQLEEIPPAQPPSREEVLNSYKERLFKQIEAHKHYPELAVRMGLGGTVVVYFTLNRTGALEALYIPRGGESDFAPFNREALRAVRQASSGFPAFPEILPEEKQTFRLPVSFELH